MSKLPNNSSIAEKRVSLISVKFNDKEDALCREIAREIMRPSQDPSRPIIKIDDCGDYVRMIACSQGFAEIDKNRRRQIVETAYMRAGKTKRVGYAIGATPGEIGI